MSEDSVGRLCYIVSGKVTGFPSVMDFVAARTASRAFLPSSPEAMGFLSFIMQSTKCLSSSKYASLNRFLQLGNVEV